MKKEKTDYGDIIRRQIDFIIEADKLKKVLRQTSLYDGSRRENSAEHSWHIALMAMILSEHASMESMDLLKVMKMLIIHDLSEIYCGDMLLYQRDNAPDRADEERASFERVIGTLPSQQADEIHSLWKEFEERRTPEAKFAAALDRLQPMISNYCNNGGAWKEHGITSEMIAEKNRHMEEGAPALWDFAKEIIRRSIEQGFIKE